MDHNLDAIREHLKNLQAVRIEAVKRRDSATYRSAHERVLAAERELASLQASEYAEPIKDAPWQPEFPRPLVWQDETAAWVICPQPSRTRPLRCKVVRFEHILGLRTSVVSGDLEDQPLGGKGLESCMALEVRNSKWISSFRVTSHESKDWAPARHFALCFKDYMVEAAAISIEWLEGEKSLADWLKNMTKSSLNSPTFSQKEGI